MQMSPFCYASGLGFKYSALSQNRVWYWSCRSRGLYNKQSLYWLNDWVGQDCGQGTYGPTAHWQSCKQSEYEARSSGVRVYVEVRKGSQVRRVQVGTGRGADVPLHCTVWRLAVYVPEKWKFYTQMHANCWTYGALILLQAALSEAVKLTS